MEKKSRLRNQEGFTLIEIIAVLIILGILAAVAVPRFINLTEQAELKALDGALAAGKSTCSLEFGRLILSTGSAPSVGDIETVLADDANHPAGDDFTWDFTASGTSYILIKATKTDSSRSNTATWKLPN